MRNKRPWVCVYTSTDRVFHVELPEALDMLDQGLVWIVRKDPLVLREARSLEYRDEARNRRGRVVPGIDIPNPSRCLDPNLREVFDHPVTRSSTQGRCFPREKKLTDLERDYLKHWHECTRRESETNWLLAEQQRRLAELHNYGNQRKLKHNDNH